MPGSEHLKLSVHTEELHPRTFRDLSREAPPRPSMAPRGAAEGLGEAQLVAQMRDAQRRRETWVDCARGDRLRVIDFADMVEAAFEQSDAQWQESLRRYLGSTAVVEQADAASVKARHEDGQALWWPYGAVKVVSRQPRAAAASAATLTRSTCSPGDLVRTVGDAAAAQAAFAQSDARWNRHALPAYLGKRAEVRAAEERSVHLLFQDGQRLWFPYAAVTAEHRAPKAVRACACGDVLRTVQDEAAAREAFAASDARFTPSLRAYLGTTGTAQQVDVRSVLLRHGDGQRLWWPYSALTMLQAAPVAPRGCGGEASSGQPTVLGAWGGVRGCAAAAVASSVVFATVHMPHPAFVALYFAIMFSALVSDDEVASFLSSARAGASSSAGALCVLWSAALVAMGTSSHSK